MYWQPHLMYNGSDVLNALVPADGNYVPVKRDERTVFRSFMSINKLLNDPLTGKLDFEGSKADSHVYASYALWFGWQYRTDKQSKGYYKGMFKLGDRFQCQDQSYNLLATDNDAVPSVPTGTVQTCHADGDGKCYDQVLQDGAFDFGAGQQASVQLTISIWRLDKSAMRGPVDLNFAYDDGSIRRCTGVTWRYLQDNGESMSKLPEWNTQRTGSYYVTVPNP